MKRLGAILLACMPLVAGCLGSPTVVRVYDGRVVEGAFVSPEAYASYLRGVLAEESGDLRTAVTEYERAAQVDDDDAEPYTRAGTLRCKLDPKDRGADDDFSRAKRIDRTYAPLIAAKARCLATRGSVDEAVEVISEIAPADRQSVDFEALFVRLAAQRSGRDGDRVARERAIALTLASGDEPVAWDALVSWGRGKADAELFARGLEGLLSVAPTRHGDVEAGVLELLGVGQAGLARRVAGRLADMPVSLGVARIQDSTVARLAIDDALLTGDGKLAERRAVRGHVAMSEVAARALILERPELALSVASDVAVADPTAGCARMVIAAAAARSDSTSAANKALRAIMTEKQARVNDHPAAACVLVFAERLATVASPEVVRDWSANVDAMPLSPHDPVTGPLAVDLAARGVVDDKTLPLELRLELAARRREAPPAVDVAAVESHVVDAKHALLWHLLVDPTGAPAKSLLSRMYSAADRDPIVGFALARAALAATPPAASAAVMWGEALRVIASSPSNPLLLAVAVDIAKKGGRPEDVSPARARLMAFARTPAERALATE